MADPESTVNRDESTLSLFVEATFADVPDRIPLLPTPGLYPHPTYGNVDLSPGVVDSIVANFQRETYQKHIPIDAEHNLKESGAAAYIRELHRNADGSVDASVDWTDLGRTLIANDRFRYISPAIKPEWTNPATGETHKHILAGAGLTTRPFFKEQSLRPLIVASEPSAERKESIHMADDPKPTPTPEPTPEPTPAPQPEPTPDGEQSFAELSQQFSELQKANTRMADELTRLRSDQEERTFREEVEGRSKDNDARYLGDVDKHVAILKALPEANRTDYMELQRTQAKAAKTFAERPEIGSDALHGNQQGAFAEATRKAVELREKNPKLTKEQAFAEVVKADPALYRRYQAEKQA